MAAKKLNRHLMKTSFKTHLKKGDQVIILTGRDKGRQGKIISLSLLKQKIKVEGIQMVKKTVKPNPQMQKSGGIIEKEAEIHLSNVAIFNPVSQKRDKIRIELKEDGKKVRKFKSDNTFIEIER